MQRMLVRYAMIASVLVLAASVLSVGWYPGVSALWTTGHLVILAVGLALGVADAAALALLARAFEQARQKMSSGATPEKTTAVQRSQAKALGLLQVNTLVMPPLVTLALWVGVFTPPL
ncbi:MAG TPA: hypothetical protein VMQ11_19695 [Alphaproteobacteria bacterium]|nr:hypothetical protein [Alphaproteobacteria bacterium]